MMKMMKIRIPTADDSHTMLETKMGYYRYYNKKEVSITNFVDIYRTTTKDPIHDGICNWFKGELHNDKFWNDDYNGETRGYESHKTTIEFVFSNYSVMITKGSNLKANGQTVTKTNLCHILARLLYASINDKDRSSIRDKFFQLLTLPNNVSYALENKVPFHWYKSGHRVDVRLGITLISSNEAAIEISDGIWGAMSIKELDVFLNYFIHNLKRSAKWTYASPKTLFVETMGREPTSGEYELMLAFLEQNRTSKLVEDRARQLLDDMTTQYSDRLLMVEKPHGHDEDNTKIHIRVRGIVCDWLLLENYNTSAESTQKVSIYCWESSVSENNLGHFLNGRWNGPICVDNLVRGSSLGDQFASRILALLNDKHTMARVSTLRDDYSSGITTDPLPLSEVTANDGYKLSTQLTKLCSKCHRFVTTTEDYDSGIHASCLQEEE